jgi:hypothetical protein
MYVCGILPVTVYNAVTGDFFYKSPKGSKGVFSVPAGSWIFDKECSEVAFRRKLPKMPKPERNIKRPDRWTVIKAPNPAKCTINLERGRILFDSDLWNSLNHLQRLFILLHEFGHYFYKTEHFCDLYAKKELLKMGYNRSQIAAVDFDILSNSRSSFARKKYTFDKIKKL